MHEGNSNSDVVCTLFEGHHGLGAGTLLNSLHRAGYQGVVYLGYRGPRPRWADRTAGLRPIRTKWVELDTADHFTSYKPRFLQQCVDHEPGAERAFYFDPDIVLKAGWSLFQRWATGGLAAVQDVNGDLPPQHPYRLQWRDFLIRSDRDVKRELPVYVNAGFVGLDRPHFPFLGGWMDVLDLAREELGSLSMLKQGQAGDLFHTPDQDALNMALEVSDVPLHWAGMDAMDFAPGGQILSHAIGGPKPWEGGRFRLALQGRPPGAAHWEILKHLDLPLAVTGPQTARRLRRDAYLASAIGRLYRRTS
jgi:hypothetical protein